MTYLFLLSQEHPDLPRAEVEAVLNGEGIDHEISEAADHLLEVEADEMRGVERLAMTFEVAELIRTFDPSTYQKLATKEFDVEGTFAVRVNRVDDTAAPDELEQNVGRIIDKQSEASVDLDEPDTVFPIFLVDGEAHLCRRVAEIDRGQFEARQNQYRPYSAPVSIHPRLARALVNLSEVERDGTVLDPFCGTGGILIEAAMIGCDVTGLDVQQEMVDGTKENLAAYDLDGDIRQGDIADLADLFEDPFDAIVTDLPYGRASKTDGDPLEAFLDTAPDMCEGKMVFVTNEELDEYDPDFEIFVHRSLSRYIYVLD